MTAHMKTINGLPCLIPNRTDEVKTGSPHWYISYNSWDREIYGSDTTALVLGQVEYILVLDGDHRQGFQDAINASNGGLTTGLSRCLAYVREHREQLNKYSDAII